MMAEEGEEVCAHTVWVCLIWLPLWIKYARVIAWLISTNQVKDSIQSQNYYVRGNYRHCKKNTHTHTHSLLLLSPHSAFLFLCCSLSLSHDRCLSSFRVFMIKTHDVYTKGNIFKLHVWFYDHTMSWTDWSLKYLYLTSTFTEHGVQTWHNISLSQF